MRNFLRWLLGDPPPALAAQSLADLRNALAELEVRQKNWDKVLDGFERDIKRLKSESVEREAEHAAQMDKLQRVYKRVSQRIAMENTHPELGYESPLELRRRLGR